MTLNRFDEAVERLAGIVASLLNFQKASREDEANYSAVIEELDAALRTEYERGLREGTIGAYDQGRKDGVNSMKQGETFL